MHRKKLIQLARISISLLIIGYLLKLIDIENFDFLLPGITSTNFLLSAVLLTIGIHLSYVGQLILFNHNGYNMSRSLFARTFYCSMIVGMVLPGRIGDFSLAALMKEHAKPATTISLVLADKIMSVVGFLTMGTLLSIAYGLYFWAALSVAALIGLFLMYVTLHILSQRLSVKSRGWSMIEWALARISEIDSLSNCSLLQNCSIKIARLFLFTASIYLMIAAFGEHADFFRVSLGVTAVHLSSLLPISFQGIGVTELVYLGVFQQNNVSLEVIIAFSMLVRLLMMIITSALYGFFCIKGKQRHPNLEN